MPVQTRVPSSRYATEPGSETGHVRVRSGRVLRSSPTRSGPSPLVGWTRIRVSIYTAVSYRQRGLGLGYP